MGRNPEFAGNPSEPIRIGVVDSYPLMLAGLEHLLEREPGISVVASGVNGADAIRIAENVELDVLLLDAELPAVGGVDVLQAIHDLPFRGRVILHAGEIDDRRALGAIRLGVRGVILKKMAPMLLVQCIRRVHSGYQWLEKDSLVQVLDVMLRKEDEKQRTFERLTPREAEIVQLAATGLANKKIATRLSISTSTVKSHLHSIYEKLHVDGRWALSEYARQRELI